MIQVQLEDYVVMGKPLPTVPKNNILYAVFYGSVCLYVGSSSDPAIRLAAHLSRAKTNKSLLGKLVRLHHPLSSAWVFECYTIEEAIGVVPPANPNAKSIKRNRSRRQTEMIAEALLIKKLNPCLNIDWNVTPTELPQDLCRASTRCVDTTVTNADLTALRNELEARRKAHPVRTI